MTEKLIQLLAGRLAKGPLRQVIESLAAKLAGHVEFFHLEVEGEMRPCIRVAEHLLLTWHPRPKGAEKGGPLAAPVCVNCPGAGCAGCPK